MQSPTTAFLAGALLLAVNLHAENQRTKIMNNNITPQKLVLTQEWDKTFPKSDKVNHRKVTFVNRYGITLAADLYEPKNAAGKLAAIAVSGPFGAVKEQCSGLYAQTLAERGFLTIAFDPSFTGESGGTPRRMASPDINTEDFQAAVDFLSTQPNVDSERIGILGICGWGGLALNAAALDTRIKATVASTMYNMSRVNANGYFDAADNEKARYETRQKLNAQRTKEYAQGFYEQGGGVVEPLPADAPAHAEPVEGIDRIDAPADVEVGGRRRIDGLALAGEEQRRILQREGFDIDLIAPQPERAGHDLHDRSQSPAVGVRRS